MARIRSTKPEFWSDQELTRLPRDVRLLYKALWNFCDEEGRMEGDPRLVKSWCFPLDDDVTAEVIDEWLSCLQAVDKVVRYESGGSAYLFLPNLGRHQKLDPRLRSRLPAPPGQTPPDTDPTDINTNRSGRTDVPNTDATPTGQVAGGREQVAGEPPPRTCPKHRNHPDPPNCGACRNHRIAREEYDGQQFRAEQERRVLVSNCRLCDGDGWRLEVGRHVPITPYEACDHRLRSVS